MNKIKIMLIGCFALVLAACGGSETGSDDGDVGGLEMPPRVDLIEE